MKPERLVVMTYGKPFFISCQGFAVNCGSANTVQNTGELVRPTGGWLQLILDQSLTEFKSSRHFLPNSFDDGRRNMGAAQYGFVRFGSAAARAHFSSRVK